MKKQKGQSLVEFALVVPFLFLLLFGLIYSGMLFYDYSMLSTIARSAAREAAIVEGTNYSNIKTFYEQQSKNKLTTLYRTESIDVASETQTDGTVGVRVRIHLVRSITSQILNVVTPPTFDIVYFMKKDLPTASSTGS